jgi:superfamily II DNA or RNA helicase
LEAIQEIFQESRIAYVVQDKTQERLASKGFVFDPNLGLRPYQRKAIDTILKHRTCLVEGAAGSGKTEVILGAIAKANQRSGVVVCSSNLFEQWLERIEKRLGIPRKQIGQIRGGRKKWVGDQITIMMLQSAVKMIPNLQGVFGFIGNDEVHHAAAQTNYNLIDSFDSAYRVGASARIKRSDLRHPLTHDLFGPVRFEIGRQELEQKGYLQKVDLLIVPTDFYFDYMHEDFLAKNAPEINEENNNTDYLTALSKDRARNNLIYSHVRRELDSGSTCAVFVKRIEQAKLWAHALEKNGIPCALLWSGTGKKETRKMIDRLKKREIRIAIGTVFEEGIDIPAMDAGFLTYRTMNTGMLEQMAGRLARKATGKNKARFYVFWDHLIGRFADDADALKKLFDGGRIVEEARRVRA